MFKIFPLVVIMVLSSFSLAQTPPLEPGVSHDLAIWRAARYSDVRYKLNLTLEKMSPVLKGTIEIRVKVGTATGAGTLLSRSPQGGEIPPIILDWRKIRGHEDASTISNVSINRKAVQQFSPPGGDGDKSVPAPFEESNEHLIFRDGVVPGENVIKLHFTSPILTSGSAITRYIDKEDGAEYIYSLFVPSDASTVFPVFDQPDLKARFQLTVGVPVKDNGGWRVVSNSKAEKMSIGAGSNLHDPDYGSHVAQIFTTFEETKPISTYVFAFAAGPFEEFSPDVKAGKKDVYKKWLNNDVSVVTSGGGNLSGSEGAPSKSGATSTLPTGRVSASEANLESHVYVRKSQAEKFKPHAAETFRLMREGIKYLETYFDYKFPWPKYDLVLIPEFPFGGMEHAGATFVREQSIIFPTEPTKSDYINRAILIFHETAHQWFGDTVTMQWFDDLWLKEGFAQFMAYKAMEKIMPEMNAWKVFYERIKQPAYATDSTKGTTPIYQPIANLSAAKSAYGNIVYNKAPAFLRQAEFYLGEEKFQTAVRAFLKKHEFANATWEDLVTEFETATRFTEVSSTNWNKWVNAWVNKRGLPRFRITTDEKPSRLSFNIAQENALGEEVLWKMRTRIVIRYINTPGHDTDIEIENSTDAYHEAGFCDHCGPFSMIFPNYQDYGYGIFLLDDKSRDYVLKNVQNEKDPFLRSMMYGSLWDSVREAELDPKEYVELVIKNLPTETDETIIQSLLGRTSMAMNYYIDEKSGGKPAFPTATDSGSLRSRLEDVLIERMQNASTLGQRITFYRAFLNIASSENARKVLKEILRSTPIPLKTKDRFDIVTRLAILGDPDAPKLLEDLEKVETGDDAKRYAYAAHAAFATKENREKFWNDFVNNKSISESWIEAAMGPFNSIRHDDLSLPYLQRALAELPNLKRDRKIFFVNGWLGAFIGGQKSQAALDIVNKFLADNPNLDNDLRLKILENVDVIERAVKIRSRYAAR